MVNLVLLLLGDPTDRFAQVNKEQIDLTEEDRKAIFAVADSIKEEMKALRSKFIVQDYFLKEKIPMVL